jgi:hypothetical protein
MKKSILIPVFTGILTGVLVSCVFAQTFLLQSVPKEKIQAGFCYMRPSFQSEYLDDLSILSGVYDLWLNVPVGNKLSLVGSIQIVNSKFGDRDTESGIGNLFFGLQSHSGFGKKNFSVGTFGLFLPTADSDISWFGMLTDYYGFHKYWDETITLYGNYAFHRLFSQGGRLGIEIGPTLLIPTEGKYRDTELFIHYGLAGGVHIRSFAVSAELLGQVLITEDVDEFGDRFVHSLNFGFSYVSKRISPGIFYKIYLDEDMSDTVDGVLGIKIGVTMN